MFLILLCFVVIFTVIAKAEDIAAFYHTSVTDDDRHLKIIQSQINHMNSTGVLSKINKVYYGVIHPPTVAHKKKLKINNEKFVNIGYWYKGQEMKTLSVLYSFCKSNPGYKVLYFHMKGGSNSLLRNLQARETLDAFTLNPACISALDSYETCGWRFSPVPYMHYSGNYWWARCTYINKLIDPKYMTMESSRQTYAISEMLKYYSQEEQKQDFIRAKMRMEICVGLGRFFGEAWIGSATYVNAADCMPDNADKNFIMYGEYVPAFLPLAEQYTTNKLQMV